ncbi:hypothetical protein BS78_02G123900 [Paspalum vaginatum]|nr:hypothetical protein BS78_02G123900 [Paspalum vaginatum]
MEEDAATASKRIKRDPIDVQGNPKTGNRAGGDESLNFIDRLPDEVLATIISLLPTKAGARTQAVSRRWRPLWRAAPLSLLADSDLSGQDRKRTAFVSKILADHTGPARRFELPEFRLRDRYAKIDGWLRSRALDGLQKIEFSYAIEDPLLPYPMPPSALRFAPTLRFAEFGPCDFPSEIAPSLKFPCLKQLTLYSVDISQDALHNLLSGCLVLESLLLEYSIGVGCLRISSSTLRSIGFCGFSFWRRGHNRNPIKFQELVIEDAPCLERLLPLDPSNGPVIIRVMHAPKLQILGLLSSCISRLDLGTTVFQKMIALSLTTSMRTVKVLALDSAGPNLKLVVDFLRCFPCLQKLHIMSHVNKDMKNKLSYNPLDPIECFETHLQQVVVNNYWGLRPDVDFAKFIILNAKVLNKMVFGTVHNNNGRWMTNQLRRLQLDKRAAKDAQFKFTVDCLLAHDLHTHALCMDDPFDSHLWHDA